VLKSFTLCTLGAEKKQNDDFEKRLMVIEETMSDISMTDFEELDDSCSTIREQIKELRGSKK